MDTRLFVVAGPLKPCSDPKPEPSWPEPIPYEDDEDEWPDDKKD